MSARHHAGNMQVNSVQCCWEKLALSGFPSISKIDGEDTNRTRQAKICPLELRSLGKSTLVMAMSIRGLKSR